ncbi:sugar phosphate isomerase/epimerase [Anaerobacillus sp. CMMVII]|uniref:sugar phosphate isomerase/epimerase family protein n=1 Tax=Anaerobacillus sp. CMMVII TaxID=2755588 RepID=UPI0021B7BF47|nr:sugar phosphate isomerase/epimerase [Anaerobacillus sp. CMMVII]MCT8139601.1 sugar phosphate isomerase/epimerase [Anaerobacillus sp. CMMVII]
MSVGVLAHLCGKSNYKEVAKNVGSYGFSHVQLALWKAFDDIDYTKPGKLSPGLAKLIRDEFQKYGVSISVLGCYLHLFDRNEEQRRRNIERFKEILRHAKFFGTATVAVEVGKLPNNDFTDQDWLNLKETLNELVEEAQKWGIFIGIEAAEHHMVDNAVKLKQLLDEVPSSNIGVVLDPGNLITIENIANQDEVIEEMFHLLGNKVVAFQAKDCLVTDTNTMIWTPIGKGQLNYELIFKKLFEYKPYVDIILDTVKPENMAETKQYIESMLTEVASLSVK